jgi:small subunit ribosomal protein S20
MPHTSSAKKRLRQTEKRRARNRSALRTIKEQIKKLLDVVQTGTLDDAKKEYNLAAKRLDKAAAHKVIHKNTAARRKSQLAKLVRDKQTAANTAPASPPAAPTA